MIGAVVLNYKNYECTIDCVKCLQEQNIKALEICIVDNGSQNGSAEALRFEFGDSRGINIIANADNAGFACGNNAGIDYLRDRGCTDILIVNPDVFIEDKDALLKLLERKKCNLGVISPLVYSKDKQEKAWVFIRKKSRFRFRMAFELIFTILKGFRLIHFLRTIYNSIRNSNTARNNAFCTDINSGNSYAFAGCIFLLTSEFFKAYSGLFRETFLFYEEWATAILLNKAGLDAEIADVGYVYHIGATSTGDEIITIKHKHERDSALKILRLLLAGKKYSD